MNLTRKGSIDFRSKSGASLSISNNIAEGSGSNSKAEFARFLNIVNQSAFENANMTIVFEKRGLISAETMEALLLGLEQECRMITGFIRSLKRAKLPAPC